MGVGADDKGRQTIQRAAEGDLFGGRLGVEIDHDAGGLGLEFFDFGFDEQERIIDLRSHEGAAQHVDDAQFLAIAADHDRSEARCAGRKIERAKQTRFRGEIGDDFALVPGVIAQGDDVRPGAHEVDREARGNAVAARRVLAVDDEEVGFITLAQQGNGGAKGVAPRLTDDIAKKDEFHEAEIVEGCGRFVMRRLKRSVFEEGFVT